MYRHLLVPVERSDPSVEAIGHAVELARSLGARITFVCRDAGEGGEGNGQTQALLARAEAAARSQGVPASVVATNGNTAFDGIGTDDAREYDLVCLPQGSAVPPLPGVAVLVCPGDARPMVTKALGALLAAHRACSDAYDEALRSKRLYPRTIDRLQEAHREETELVAALRERTSALDAELDEIVRLAGREAALLASVADAVTDEAAIEDNLHACARFAWERMGRIEGAVLPAARRYLRDADWNALAGRAR